MKKLQHYPNLSQDIHWGKVTAHFSLTKSINESLVSNVSIIPVIDDKYAVIQIENGLWELPGGTLEVGETYINALRREVMEEMGGNLIHYEVFGQFTCHSSAPQPFRPHIPHPTFIRVVGLGEVELVTQPLNPQDGEQVVAVDVVDIHEAVSRFEGIKRYDLAELYQLAHAVRTRTISE